MGNIYIQNFLRVFRASFLTKGLVQNNIIKLSLEFKKIMTFTQFLSAYVSYTSRSQGRATAKDALSDYLQVLKFQSAKVIIVGNFINGVEKFKSFDKKYWQKCFPKK